MGFTLVLGGARSGKSDLAYRLARDSGRTVTVIATATAGDAEMTERIARHRAARPRDWSTVEEPVELSRAVLSAAVDSFVVLDCLTLWVSNLLGEGGTEAATTALAIALADELVHRHGVVVSNEVGLGIVPANELARSFRDALGRVNAAFAERAERSVLMVAGRALELTSPAAVMPSE
jgi:adenosyl cobinamide kinase/adenosyl cobinamide phosphate guanylyltransferase